MINNNQFVNNVLTGNGIISNPRKKSYKIWFMRKVLSSILSQS